METVGRRFSWASLPLIATVSRLLQRNLMHRVEYLKAQRDVLLRRLPDEDSNAQIFGPYGSRRPTRPSCAGA